MRATWLSSVLLYLGMLNINLRFCGIIGPFSTYMDSIPLLSLKVGWRLITHVVYAY